MLKISKIRKRDKVRKLIYLFMIIVFTQLMFPIESLSKHINLSKIEREEYINKKEDGPWFIFSDMAAVLDGFFGVGRYEPPEIPTYNPYEVIEKED